MASGWIPDSVKGPAGTVVRTLAGEEFCGFAFGLVALGQCLRNRQATKCDGDGNACLACTDLQHESLASPGDGNRAMHRTIDRSIDRFIDPSPFVIRFYGAVAGRSPHERISSRYDEISGLDRQFRNGTSAEEPQFSGFRSGWRKKLKETSICRR
jgi:hypothetical protein